MDSSREHIEPGVGAARGGSVLRAKARQRVLWILYGLYILAFLIYLYAPLVVVSSLSFNDRDIPSFPWKGFTTDWYYNPAFGEQEAEGGGGGSIGIGRSEGRMGIFNDNNMLDAIKNSLIVAAAVTGLCLVVGTITAFLFERHQFAGSNALYFLMIAPLVIPGVILGVSILAFANTAVAPLRALLGYDLARPIVRFLRPNLLMVVLGQFSFIGTMATLIISGRLRRFSIEQEQAAMDLGASRMRAVFSVTIPFLTPALFSAGVVSFLLSFENFGTTLFLIGTNPTVPILFFSRLRFEVTPEINAVSVLLMISTVLLAMAGLGIGRIRGR
jgi:spermidine/putrescine transport system permease protein